MDGFSTDYCADTEEFLRLLYACMPDGYLGITYIAPEGVALSPDNITQFKPLPLPRVNVALDFTRVHEMNARGYSVYFRVMAQNQSHEWYRRGLTQESIYTRVLWTEVDFKDIGQDAALAAVERFPHYPSIVVSSGGGLHLYWLLRQVIVTHGASWNSELNHLCVEPDDLKRTLKGIGKAIGCADTKVAELCRVMRLPGTINTKPSRYGAPCEVIDMRGPDYDYRELELEYAPLIKKPMRIRRELPAAVAGDMPKWVQTYLESGAGRGERNQRLYAVSREYLNRGRTEMDAIRDLGPRASLDGLEDHEIESTIHSAYRASVTTPSISPRYAARLAAHDALLEE